MILVSHRLKQVAAATEFYVMDAGKIIEEAPTKNSRRGGAYYRMAKHQMKLGEPVGSDARAPSPTDVPQSSRQIT